jgi:hypothetical protein
MAVVSDAAASGGKAIWSATTSSTSTVPSNGHVTFSFTAASGGVHKCGGASSSAPPARRTTLLWVRFDSGSWILWNNIYPRVQSTSSYSWDSMHDSSNGDAEVTFSLAPGAHTLEVAYREDGLKMDRFLVTTDLVTNLADAGLLHARDGRRILQPPRQELRRGDRRRQLRQHPHRRSCGSCTSPQTCGGGGTANVCGGGTSSCSFTVTQNVYDGPNWWGTITFKNNGPSSSSSFKVDFDVPSGATCDWADTAAAGRSRRPATTARTGSRAPRWPRERASASTTRPPPRASAPPPTSASPTRCAHHEDSAGGDAGRGVLPQGSGTPSRARPLIRPRRSSG